MCGECKELRLGSIRCTERLALCVPTPQGAGNSSKLKKNEVLGRRFYCVQPFINIFKFNMIGRSEKAEYEKESNFFWIK